MGEFKLTKLSTARREPGPQVSLSEDDQLANDAKAISACGDRFAVLDAQGAVGLWSVDLGAGSVTKVGQLPPMKCRQHSTLSELALGIGTDGSSVVVSVWCALQRLRFEPNRRARLRCVRLFACDAFASCADCGASEPCHLCHRVTTAEQGPRGDELVLRAFSKSHESHDDNGEYENMTHLPTPTLAGSKKKRILGLSMHEGHAGLLHRLRAQWVACARADGVCPHSSPAAQMSGDHVAVEAVEARRGRGGPGGRPQ